MKTSKFSLSILKKIVMSVTGLLMVAFLVLHLAGNFLMFFGKDLYNEYSMVLLAIPVITPGIELGLAVILLIHVVEAFATWKQNKNARPVGYAGGKEWATHKSTKSRKSWSSVLMMWSGIIILVFIVLHVVTMKYGTEYMYTPGGGAAFVQAPAVTGEGIQPAAANMQVVQRHEIRDLFKLVVQNFKNPLIAVLYLFAMAVLGGHLYHAVWSSSQTLGATNNGWRKTVLWLGSAFAILLATGFFIIPLWVFFFVKPQ